MAKSENRVLVVDDDDGMRTMLSVYLQHKGYRVQTAINGRDALDLMENTRPHIVLADIHMPVMDGFELLRHLEESFPKIKRILMTGYDIDSYIEMIRKHNVGNILAKGDSFNIEDWGRYIDAIASGDVFGLARMLPNHPIQVGIVDCNDNAADVCSRIVAEYQGPDRVFFEIALNELVRNAVYHGALGLSDKVKDAWQEDFSLQPEQAVRVSWAGDEERLGVSVEDPLGRLRKVDVLRWLDHPVEEEATDGHEHGRGFMLVRKIIDRFVINIDRGKRTECIIVQHFDRAKRTTKKSLLIHEV